MAWAKYYTYTPDATKAGTVDSTNFTALVKVTHNDLRTVANGGLVTNANGYDIAPFQTIVGSTPTTLLKFERVFYDGVAGTWWAWVKQPTLSVTSGVPFIVAYANAAITTDQADPTNAWDANYKAVYNFGDGSTVNLGDSTTNAQTLTNINTTPATTSPAGGGIALNGTTRSLERLASTPVAAPPMTIEVLFNPAIDPGGSTQLVAIAKQGTAGFAFSLIYKTGRLLQAQGIGSSGVATVAAATLGAWQTAQATFTSDTRRDVYLNAANNQFSVVSATGYAPDDISIGAIHSSVITQWFQGSIGGVRVSNVVRSVSWMLAQHNTWTSPSTFLVESGPTALNTNPSASITTPANLATVALAASTSFSGTGTDPEDGTLTGSSLVWTSNIDGTIGTGTSFSTSSLSLGTHTITLTATDSGGLTGTANRTLVVATAATAAAVAADIAFIAANGGDANTVGLYDRRVGVTVVSAAVSSWAESVGTFGGRTAGPTLSQATSARRLTFTGTQGTGSERISAVTATDQWMASSAIAALDASLNADLYIFACYTATANGPVVLIASDETSATTYPCFGIYPASSKHAALIGTAAGGVPSPSYVSDTGVALSATRVIEYVGHHRDLFANANIVWRHNHAGKNVKRRNAITRATAGNNKIVVGRLGTARGTFELDAFWITTQRPTKAIIRAWNAYCDAEHGAAARTSIKRVLFPADSLGYGSQSTDPMTPADGTGTKSPSYICVTRNTGPGTFAALGYDVAEAHSYNYGISGDNISRINDDWEYDIAINSDGSEARGIIVMRGIGNRVQSNGDNLAALQTLAQTIKGKADTMGWKIIWTTEVDRGAGANGSNGNSTGWHLSTGGAISVYGQTILDFNAWLRAAGTYALAGHYLPIDTALVTQFVTIPTAGSNNCDNATYYADTVHLTDAGYALMGNNWKDYFDANAGVLVPGAAGAAYYYQRAA